MECDFAVFIFNFRNKDNITDFCSVSLVHCFVKADLRAVKQLVYWKFQCLPEIELITS